MSTVDTFQGIEGFFFLSSDGVLGKIDQKGDLVPDKLLTNTFAETNEKVLKAYAADKTGADLLIAIIVPNDGRKKWKTPTLIFHDTTIREIYPASGPDSAGLSPYQIRNRERSLAQGMELFLDFRNANMPGIPIFCPVLFQADLTLDGYREGFGLRVDESNRYVEVIEVLNLVALIEPTQRKSWGVEELIDQIRRDEIKKDLRTETQFEIYNKPIPSSIARQDAKHPADAHSNIVDEPSANDSVLIGLDSPTTKITGQDLSRFDGLSQLAQGKLTVLAEIAEAEKASAGSLIIERETEDEFNYYLLDGTVSLESVEGASVMVQGGSDDARYPLSYMVPRKYRVVARSHTQYFKLPRKVVANLLGSESGHTVQAVNIEAMRDREQALLDLLDQEIATGNPRLLVHPEIAAAVRRRTATSRATAAELISLAMADPVITVRVVGRAYRRFPDRDDTPISCAEAVELLGTRETADIIDHVSTEQTFRTASQELGFRLKMAWRQSLELRFLASSLAARSPGIDPEVAATAGLINRIGEIALIVHAEQTPEIKHDLPRLEKLLVEKRGEIGSRISNACGVIPDLSQTLSQSEDWQWDSTQEISLSDIMITARLHQNLGFQKTKSGPKMDEVPAFRKLVRGGFSPQDSLATINEARERLAGTLQALALS